MSEIVAFCKAVARHWGSLVTGGIVIGALAVWQGTGHRVAPGVFWVIASCALLLSFFLAWKDQVIRAERAEAALESLSAERLRATLAFSEAIYTGAYYREVATVVWGIAMKWKHLTPNADRVAYQAAVCSGFVNYEKPYERLTSGAQPKDGSFLNWQSHGAPINLSRHGMSVHQALSVWIHRWELLEQMIAGGLADGKTARILLAGFYEYWLEFMIQFRLVVRTIQKPVEVPHRWIEQLDRLECDRFAYPDYLGTRKSSEDKIRENIPLIEKIIY
jgi:hypothetical protein